MKTYLNAGLLARKFVRFVAGTGFLKLKALRSFAESLTNESSITSNVVLAEKLVATSIPVFRALFSRFSPKPPENPEKYTDSPRTKT